MLYRLAFFLVWLTAIPAQAQVLSGTWLASYYRDKPGDKRVFYYRLYLKQAGDATYGICEVLDPQADLKRQQPEEASIVACYRVYNDHHFPVDGNRFQLYISNVLAGNQGSVLAAGVPDFLSLNCKVASKREVLRESEPLIFSAMPAYDDSRGDLLVCKTSDSVRIDDRWEDYIDASDKQEKDTTGTFFSLLGRKQEKPVQVPETNKNISPFLPMHQRVNDVQAMLNVKEERVKLDLYDNGEIDNDTVSLFFNGKILAAQQRLSSQPLHWEISLENEVDNTFLLFAHNLGTIPPNTALLVVTVGTERYTVNLQGSLQKNALVLMRVKEPEKHPEKK